MSKPRTMMVVAGGDWQVPLVQKAKGLGLRVVNTNLCEDSPGFAYADLGIVADVCDRDRHLEIAREVGPDAIVTDQSDIAVPTVAYLCDELGLPGIGAKSAELFTNKRLMREFRHAQGFPNPRYQACASPQALEDFFAQTGNGPLVVKPPANQSSRGVTMVDAKDQLASAFASAKSHSNNGSILAEEYVGGPEITVEGLKLPTKHYSLAVSIKEHYQHNPMVASRLLYARRFSEFDVTRLTSQHDRFIESTGLSFGITHSEYKFSNDEFYLIEAAARGGGTKVSSHIIPLMSGIDANDFLLRMTLGEDPPPNIAPSTVDRFTVLQFFDFEPGQVAAIRGLDSARGLRGVVDIGVSFLPGAILNPSRDDRSRHMHLIATADSLSAVEERVARVRESIRVEYV